MPFHYTVKLLGVTLDSGLTMDRHVTGVLRSYSYHTHTLWHICLLLPLDSAKMIVHSIVSWLLSVDKLVTSDAASVTLSLAECRA